MKSTALPVRRVRLSVVPGRIARILFGISLLLSLISLAGLYLRLHTDYINVHRYVHYVVEKMSVEAEQSIPTFYSVMLLLIASALLWFISVANVSDCADKLRSRWLILSIIFLGLAADEATSLHELLIMNRLRSYAPDSVYLRWTWVIPYGLFAIAVFVLYIPFLQTLLRRTAGLLILAGGIYVSGAVGAEMIGSALFVASGPLSLQYGLIAHLEEFMEMAGLVIFIYGLSDYLMHYQVFVTIHPAEVTATDTSQH